MARRQHTHKERSPGGVQRWRGGVYLRLVPHGALAQHGDLGSGLLLQSLNGVALGTQDLAHKVELEKPQAEGARGERRQKM